MGIVHAVLHQKHRMLVVLLNAAIDSVADPDEEACGAHIYHICNEEVPFLAQVYMEVFRLLIVQQVINARIYDHSGKDYENHVDDYAHELANFFVVLNVMRRLFNDEVANLKVDY